MQRNETLAAAAKPVDRRLAGQAMARDEPNPSGSRRKSARRANPGAARPRRLKGRH
jgi:hypothetical protein